MAAKVQIKCRNIWKIFGTDPEAFLARHNGNSSPEAFKADAKIGDVAEQVLRAEKPVGVVDAQGRLVGSINRGDIATALFSRDAA